MNDILRTMINGLTYEGQWLHILINYSLIIMTVAPFVRKGDLSAQKVEHQGWKICLAIITLLQIAVRFRADAVGVSLIWSAMAGFLALTDWRGARTQAKREPRLTQIALAAVCGALLYYAVAFPVITTVAHMVALLIGMSTFLLLPRGRSGTVSSLDSGNK